MTGSPLVSVIVPNYNHARFLDQRLQSILNQTYRNIEVIILDDCSTDNSLEVIEKYKSDARVVGVVVNETNSGNTFLQWNKGLHMANGELVWIAESDDYCELNLLEELIEAYYFNDNTVIAYSTLTLVNEFGNIIYSPKVYKNQYLNSSQYLRRYLSLANFIRNASCAIFNKKAALNIPNDYTNYIGAGDYLFWVEIAKQGKVAIVNKGLSYFRRHSGVITERRDSDGTNFTSESEILNRLSSLVYISPWRKKYIYAYHCRRICNTRFDSFQIENKLFSLWQVNRNIGLFSHILLKFTDVVRNRYNIYL